MELRKRRATARFGDAATLDQMLSVVQRCRRIIMFTGSGISAASGMSMFSTRNGLYERARKKFKVQDGIKLFTYSFYRQRREEVQAFFAQIYTEAQASRAATGHYAMAQLLELGTLQRHYTLNIDGLSEVVGMDTWHHERNPQGSTVEMHGNIRQLVCPTCHAVEPLAKANINLMRAEKPVPCSACGRDQLRFKVMLYDDAEGDCITPEHVFDVLEEDLKTCDLVCWAGISFEQSASVEYFRRVRHMLGTLGRLAAVPQVLVNPSEEPYFNILSAMSNPSELRIMDVRETSDVAFPAMAQRVREALGVAPIPCQGLLLAHAPADLGGAAGLGGACARPAQAPEPLQPPLGGRRHRSSSGGGAAQDTDGSERLGGSGCWEEAAASGLRSGEACGGAAAAAPSRNGAALAGQPCERACGASDAGQGDARAGARLVAQRGSGEPPGAARRAVAAAADDDDGPGPSGREDNDDVDYEEEARSRRAARGRGRGRGGRGRGRGGGRGRGLASGLDAPWPGLAPALEVPRDRLLGSGLTLDGVLGLGLPPAAAPPPLSVMPLGPTCGVRLAIAPLLPPPAPAPAVEPLPAPQALVQPASPPRTSPASGSPQEQQQRQQHQLLLLQLLQLAQAQQHKAAAAAAAAPPPPPPPPVEPPPLSSSLAARAVFQQLLQRYTQPVLLPEPKLEQPQAEVKLEPALPLLPQHPLPSPLVRLALGEAVKPSSPRRDTPTKLEPGEQARLVLSPAHKAPMETLPPLHLTPTGNGAGSLGTGLLSSRGGPLLSLLPLSLPTRAGALGDTGGEEAARALLEGIASAKLWTGGGAAGSAKSLSAPGS